MPVDDLTPEELAAAEQAAADAKAAADKAADDAKKASDDAEAKKAQAANSRRDYKKEAEDNAREAQTLRAKLREKEDAEAAAAKEKMTETERLKFEADEAKKEAEAAKKEARTSRIESKATRLGFIDADVAVALVGDAEDIDKALEDLAKARPYLVQSEGTKGIKRGEGDKTPNNQSRAASDGAGKTTPDEARVVFPAMKGLRFPGQG
jgi:hypothetical protein